MEDLSQYMGSGSGVEIVNLIGVGMVPNPGKAYERISISAAESTHTITAVSGLRVMVVFLQTYLYDRVYLTKLTVDGQVWHSGKADISSTANSGEHYQNKFATLLQSGILVGKVIEIKLTAKDDSQSIYLGWSDIK